MATSPTLRDVARLAGVSIGTASQALNHRLNVSQETRVRVLDAATSLGYVTRSPTGDLSKSSLGVVGMITKHDLGEPVLVNPFYSHIQAGVESECRRRRLSLMFANVEVDRSNRPLVWPKMITEQQVDGLVVLGAFIEETVEIIKNHLKSPMVLVDSYAPRFPFDIVNIDNAGGTQQVMNYLLGKGHHHIGLVGTHPQSPPGVFERRSGYLQALHANGIQDSYVEDSLLSTEEGYQAARRLMERAPQLTAIFAANDASAIGVMHALQDMGLNVPRDVSVIGFDDIDIANDVRPALTTIHVYKTWMGAIAVRYLFERAMNPQQPRLTVTVATHLVERGSVCEPRQR